MKRIAALLAVVFLGSLVLASSAMAARPLTRADINDILNKKAKEIANIGAAKAQARVSPLLKNLADSLNTKIGSISGQIPEINEELDILGQQLGLIQAGITNLETTTQGSSSQIANLRLVVNEALKEQEARLAKKFEAEKLELNNVVDEQTKEIDRLRARLDKRTVFDTAKTVLGIGLGGLLIYHVLDHDGR